MKARQVLYFRNDKSLSIQGVGNPAYVAVGFDCPSADVHGGGKVGSIEYEDGMLTIRKVGADNKPHRNFGVTTLKARKVEFRCDGVMVPAGRFTGILFNDAQPEPQKQQNQGR
jgi:hypothetical protein